MGFVCPIEPVDPSFDYRFADGKNVKFANQKPSISLIVIYLNVIERYCSVLIAQILKKTVIASKNIQK